MLMPLAMPARLRTIDICPVYDGSRGGILNAGMGCESGAACGHWRGIRYGLWAGPSQAMGASAQPDTSRIQEEMHHASSPAGPLKITFGEKTADRSEERRG